MGTASLPIGATHGATAGLVPYAVGAGIGVLLAGFTLWLILAIHRGADRPMRPSRQSVMAHLEELRRRLVTVLLVLALLMALFFAFTFRWAVIAGIHVPYPWPSIYGNAAAQVFAWLSAQLTPAGVEVVVVTPWDAVVTLLGLSAAMALIAGFPVVFYHTYAFLAPALLPRERRVVMTLVPLTILLVVLGAGFGFGVMAPLILRVLYGFAAAAGATTFITMTQLVGIAALMAVLFAISFQLPLIMMATARLGVVRAQTYREKWRHAVVVIIIVAALVTDPTVVTQLIVAAVLLVLYGLGLVLAWLADRERAEPDPVSRP